MKSDIQLRKEFLHRLFPILIAVSSFAIARPAAAQEDLSCPGSQQVIVTPARPAPAQGSFEILDFSAITGTNHRPCETLVVGLSVTILQRAVSIRLEMLNEFGNRPWNDTVVSCGWATNPGPLPCNGAWPAAYSNTGTPLQGTRSAIGRVKSIKVKTDFDNGSTPSYTLTITRVPRPGYNLGGSSIANAPLVSALPASFKASVNNQEPRQYWKFDLAPGASIKAYGRFRAPQSSSWNSVDLYIPVYDVTGYRITFLLLGESVPSGNTYKSFNSNTYTNSTNQTKAVWLAVEASAGLLDVDIVFVQNNILPQLSLFLDVQDPEGQLDFNASSPTNDQSTFLPGARQNNAPSGGAPRGSSVPLPQAVQVIAAYVDAGGAVVPPPSAGAVTFGLSNVSAFDGIAMNAPDPVGAPGLDLVATSATSGVAFGLDNTARLTLAVWDYAAIGTVAASHGTTQRSLQLPKDDGIGLGVANNLLPDAGWELFQYIPEFGYDTLGSAVDAGDSQDDLDDVPLGAKAGDNLISFEEYRGFFVGPYHYRTSPIRKDVFLVNNTGVPDTDARNTGVRIYSVQFQNIAANRRINFNSTGVVGHLDQQAILAFNVDFDPLTPNRVGFVPCAQTSPLVCYPNVIGSLNAATGFDNWMPSDNLQIDVNRIHQATLPNQSTLPGDPEDPDAERSTLGHEFGHAVSIQHNTDNSSSIMREQLLDPPNAISHQFDSSDLAQIELK
jgi:hypothetical protein